MNSGNSRATASIDKPSNTVLVAPSYSALLPKKVTRKVPLSSSDPKCASSDFSDFVDVHSIDRINNDKLSELQNKFIKKNVEAAHKFNNMDQNHLESYTEPMQKVYDRFGSTRQLFWKFHIERFDPGFYLSTNPTARHVNCRSSPGYFVRIYKDRPATLISKDKERTSNTRTNSILLVFEDTVTGEAIVVVDCTGSTLKAEVLIERAVHHGTLTRKENIKQQESIKKYSLVRRKPPNEPLIDLPKLSFSFPKSQFEEVKDNVVMSNGSSSGKNQQFLLEGFAFTSPIPPSFWPMATEPQTNAKNFRADIKNQTYFIGYIPQVRDSHFNLLDRNKPPKFVRKRHLYFHQEFTSPNRQFSDICLDLVVAVVRPCEARVKKRLLRKLHSISDGSVIDRLLWGDWDLDDLKYGAGPLEATTDTGTMSQVLDIKPYSDIGDGLHFDKTPADDEPDHVHKHGWLTIYDQKIFQEGGVFDLILALTVAASYDSWNT